MKHRRDYELLPENELDKKLLEEPLTRDNYVDKFHTLLYYEEHEHARVLKERYIVTIGYVMITSGYIMQ